MIADWMARAAKQIQDGYLDDDTWAVQSEGVVAEIIAAHCPPAPRCETCAHWASQKNDIGRCFAATEIGADRLETLADFGCVRWKERT